MKDLTIKEMKVMLCSTGYLPPRNEDELMFFEQTYENYNSRLKDKHVDVVSIVNEVCRVVSRYNFDMDNKNKMFSMVAEETDCSYSMAARNFDKLPKDILEKMKKQHKPKENDED